MLLVVLLLLIPIGSNATVVSDIKEITYSKLNGYNGWTNMTIIGDSYKVCSDNITYDGFEGKFLMEPWSILGAQLIESNFFEVNITEENPHTVIEAKYQGKYNKQSISHIHIIPDELELLLDSILFRLSGIFVWSENIMVWPVDMQVFVMESYPEQYSVSVSFQRRNDLLTYIHEENATLIVTDYNVIAELSSSEKQPYAIHIDSQPIAIATGGQMISITFNTFSVGTDYSLASLHFTVLMENGVYLYFTANQTMLPQLKYHGNIDYSSFDLIDKKYPSKTEDITSEPNKTDVQRDKDTSSGQLEVPIPSLLILGTFALLPLIKKKIETY
ncbi:MAG: hypothetical protein ACXAD7_07735 [Candidatus Kariarchaeaceae archaeon]